MAAEPRSGILLGDSLPASWSYDSGISQTSPGDDRWWEVFADNTLVWLVRRAETSSYDLGSAYRRLEAARISWESAKAALYPTLDMNAGWNREQQAGRISDFDHSPVSGAFSLGFSMQWEIDVFGRVKARREAGKAGADVAQADLTAAHISLAANVAKAYFNLRSVQAQLAATREAEQSQSKIADMTQVRFEVGLVSRLDVAQANTVLLSTRAAIPSLEALERRAINTLAMLTASFPAEISDSLSVAAPLPNPFQTVGLGVPADLLRRRPDIAAAEANLARYAAQIGIAKKDFLPTLSITGSIATESHRLDGLFHSNSLSYSIAPRLSWTIFDGMARKYAVREAEQNMLAGIDDYNAAVMQAFTEAQSAIDSYAAALRRIDMVKKVLAQSDEALTLAVDRYKQGLTSFADVATAQINSMNYRNTLITATADALDDLVQIYVALGGSPKLQ